MTTIRITAVAAIKTNFPKATVTRRDKVTEKGAIRYEFQIFVINGSSLRL